MLDARVLDSIRLLCGPNPPRFLVTGGTGFVGSHLARALAEAGAAVTALGRNPYTTSRIVHPLITFRRMALADRAGLADLARRHDIVIHSAALSRPWGRPAAFREANVEGTANVADACVAAGVRLVHVSSSAIFFAFRDKSGVRDSDPLPLRSSCDYAASKRAAEAVIDRAVTRGLNAVTVRARAVFGPGDPSLIPRILQAAEDGRLRQIGSGDNFIDLTYVDNLVLALVQAAFRGPSGLKCTITNGEPVALWPTIRQVLQGCGYSRPVRRMPYPVAYALAAVLEGIARLRPGHGEPVLTRYAVGLLAKTQTFDPAAAARALGYRPIVSVAEGIERTLDAIRRRDDRPASVATQVRLFTTGYTRMPGNLTARGAPRARIDFHASFALITHPVFGNILFDTGYSPRFFDATRHFPYSIYRRITPVVTSERLSARRTLERLGIEAGSVRRIIISHLHADHICGLADFPSAEFLVAGAAWSGLRTKRGFAALRHAFLPALLPFDFADRVRPIESFADPGFGSFASAHDLFGDRSIRLVPLPGHAVGQIGALVQQDNGRRSVLIADGAYSCAAVRDQLPLPLAAHVFIASASAYMRTLEKIGAVARDLPDVDIVPTHCGAVAARHGFAQAIQDLAAAAAPERPIS